MTQTMGMKPPPELVDAMLAATGAAAARADQLGRIVESCRQSNPEFATAALRAWQAEREDMQRVADRQDQDLDDTQKSLMKTARENVALGDRRCQAACGEWTPGDGDPDRMLLECAMEIADAGQVEYHAGQMTALTDPRARRAHAHVAIMLCARTEGRGAMLEESLRGGPGRQAGTIRRALEASNRKADALERVIERRRLGMGVTIEDELGQAMERQMLTMAEEFRTSDSPVLLRTIEATAELTGDTTYVVAVIYEQADGNTICAKIADRPYPDGTEAEQAMEHAQYLYRYAEALKGRSERRTAEAANVVQQQAIRLASIAKCGLQCVDIAVLGEMFDALMSEHSVGKATVRNMVAALCADDEWLAGGLMSGLGVDEIATQAQAQAVVSAAEAAGLQPDAVGEIAQVLGYDPDTLGFIRQLPSRPAAEQTAGALAPADIPDENLTGMIMALGLSEEVAGQIIASADRPATERYVTRTDGAPRLIVP